MEPLDRLYKGEQVSGQRSPRWALWEWMKIPSTQNPGETYLDRLRIIQTPYFGVYVHWIHEPDSDRDPHDHPWNFLSFILRGGYTEYIWNNPSYHNDKAYKRRWLRGTWHKMRRGQAHRIDSLEADTISLIFVGKRQGSWGFYTAQHGWVDWRDYEELRDAEV